MNISLEVLKVIISACSIGNPGTGFEYVANYPMLIHHLEVVNEQTMLAEKNCRKNLIKCYRNNGYHLDQCLEK